MEVVEVVEQGKSDLIKPDFVFVHANYLNMGQSMDRIRQYSGYKLAINQIRGQAGCTASVHVIRTKQVKTAPELSAFSALLDADIQAVSFDAQPDELKQQLQFRPQKIERLLSTPRPLREFTVKPAKSFVILDFEAYTSSPLVLSEVGAVRVQDNQIVAQLHGFFSLSSEQIQSLKSQNQIGIGKVEKLTRIPVPWRPMYKNVQPLIGDSLKFVEQFKVFLKGSSQDILELKSEFISVKGEFAAQQCVIAAKGCQMESKVVKDWGLQDEVVEIQDMYFATHQREMPLDGIHGDREFDYCQFHVQRVKQVKEDQAKQMAKLNEEDRKKAEAKPKEEAHCAFDDCMFLARKFVQK